MRKPFYFLLALLSLGFVRTAHAQVDLEIGNISAGFNSYDNNGDKIIRGIYFTMLNNGNSSAGSFVVKIFLLNTNDYNDGYEIRSISRSGQGGNTAVDVTNINIDLKTISGLPDGQYRLNVFIDADNDVSETDENNNRLFLTTMGNDITFTSAPASQPDLRIKTGATFSYSPRVVSNLSFEVENVGSGDAGDNKYEVVLEETGGGSNFSTKSSLGSISAGSSTQVTASDIDLDGEGLPAGTYRLILRVDPDNEVAESNETNNTRVVSSNIAGVTARDNSAELNDFQLLGNPASQGQVWLRVPQLTGEATLRVVSLDGRTVHSATLTQGGQYLLQMAAPTGLYQVELKTREGWVATRSLMLN